MCRRAVTQQRIADAIAKYSEAIEADQDDNETLRATLLSNRAAAVGDGGVVRFGLWAGGV
jgi:hypothetical protein